MPKGTGCFNVSSRNAAMFPRGFGRRPEPGFTGLISLATIFSYDFLS